MKHIASNELEQIDLLLGKMASGLRKQNPDGVTDGIISGLRKKIFSILESENYSEQEPLIRSVFDRLDGFIKASYANGMDLTVSCSAASLKELIAQATRLTEYDPHSVDGFIYSFLATINDEEQKSRVEISEREENGQKMTVISTHGVNGIYNITLSYEERNRILAIMLGGMVRRLAESFNGKYLGLPCRIAFQDTDHMYGHLLLNVIY